MAEHYEVIIGTGKHILLRKSASGVCSYPEKLVRTRMTNYGKKGTKRF